MGDLHDRIWLTVHKHADCRLDMRFSHNWMAAKVPVSSLTCCLLATCGCWDKGRIETLSLSNTECIHRIINVPLIINACSHHSKATLTVYKCLRGLAPTYMADDCLAISAIAGKRHLRSSLTGMLSVPRTTTTLGMRSLAVVGPVIWNSLPAALRTATVSPLTLARHLKAHLFGWSAARLRTIYGALYKSTHHHYHHHDHGKLWITAAWGIQLPYGRISTAWFLRNFQGCGRCYATLLYVILKI